MGSGYKIRKTRYTDYDRWVGLPHFMLNSPAWRSISPNAKAILIEVWKRYNGINTGEISYSVREAGEIGLSKSPAARALLELVDRGFLQIGRNSKFSLRTKESRTWIVTAQEFGTVHRITPWLDLISKGCGGQDAFLERPRPAAENRLRS